MKDLCYAVFGISKEKKDPRDVKGNRGNILLILPIGISVTFFDEYVSFLTCIIGYSKQMD
jgi:hypothetical protein